MTGRALAVIFLLTILCCCTDREVVPGDIIVPDSMQVIMHDLIIADQFVSQYLIKDTLKRNVPKESQELYDKVFAVHATTRAAFRKSLDFYAKRPDLERSIFDSLSGNVTKERSAVYKEKYGLRDSLVKRKNDSLARVKAGPPPLNPDSLKKLIQRLHPGLPISVVEDSVHLRLQKRAKEDLARRAIAIRDSTLRHRADSIHLRRVADSVRKAQPVPGKPFFPRPAGKRPAMIPK